MCVCNFLIIIIKKNLKSETKGGSSNGCCRIYMCVCVYIFLIIIDKQQPRRLILIAVKLYNYNKKYNNIKSETGYLP